jgi:hypothetical protein
MKCLFKNHSHQEKDVFQYYADVELSLKNQSNELWWNVYDLNQYKYEPPCKSFVIISLPLKTNSNSNLLNTRSKAWLFNNRSFQ